MARDNDIPRLTKGPHMGFLEAFETLGTTTGGTNRQEVADTLRGQSIDQGMTISRVLIDWSELETSKGVYDRDALEAALDYAERQGVSPFVTLSTLDTDGLTLPQYLDGRTLNSDEVMQAWTDLLEWIVPILKERGVWALSMGNEIEILIAEGVVGNKEVLDFFRQGANTIRALDPDLAVTITFTARPDITIPNLLPKLVEQLDIVGFNYAGLSNGIRALTKQDWAADIVRFKEIAGDKDIIIQELGAPAGYGDAGDNAPPQPDGVVGASPGYQARFLKYMMKQFAYDDQLRAAVIFQLYDWSPELAGDFSQPLRDEGLNNLADKLEEWLASTGMVRWADATPRKVYDKWLDGLNLTQAVRDDDFANDTTSNAVLVFTASGEIGYRRDSDWLGFGAPGDGRYLFELESQDSALAGLEIPTLRLYDASGTLIKTGRDNGADGQKLSIDLDDADQVFLAAQGGNVADTGGWTLTAYRNLRGDAGNNDLSGSAAPDYIQGGAGRDQLNGKAGNDKIFGGKGRDQLSGNKGDDYILGKAGADLILGGAGDDVIGGGPGGDTLLGGAGKDTLRGARGDDFLDGGKGADVLWGGKGLDVMTGGGGADVFVFTTALLDGSSGAGSAEIVTDFDDARDRLDFTSIDANTIQTGTQSFTYVAGAGFTGTPAELRFADGLLMGDVDGDGIAEFAILLIGVSDLDGDALLL